MSNDVIFISGNIAIVQSRENSYSTTSAISAQELAESYGTAALPVVPSKAIAEDQFISIKLLFGTWLESVDDDKQLEELYKSRLIPSISFNE